MTEENKDQKKAQPAQQQTQQPAKKSNKTLFIILGVVGGLIACVVVVAGIGLYVASNAAKSGIKQLEEATKNIEKDGDTYKVKGKDSESQFGDDVELPDGWPEDVAVYEGKMRSASTLRKGKSFTASVVTSDSVSTITDFYKKQMEKDGWEESSKFSGKNSVTYSYTKEKRTASIYIAQDYSDKSKNAITIATGSY